MISSTLLTCRVSQTTGGLTNTKSVTFLSSRARGSLHLSAFHAAEPSFPFGFGLSYTKFDYSKLNIQSIVPARHRVRSLAARASQTGPGGPSTLYDTLYTVTFDVENSGEVDGNEVSQVLVLSRSLHETESLRKSRSALLGVPSLRWRTAQDPSVRHSTYHISHKFTQPSCCWKGLREDSHQGGRRRDRLD